MNRQEELSFMLLDYLTDWTDTEKNCSPIEESKEAIKSYGSNFDEPDDTLVKSCLRHFICIINPWNTRAAMPYILGEMGFTKSEIKLYWENLYD